MGNGIDPFGPKKHVVGVELLSERTDVIFQAPDPVPAGQVFEVAAVHGRSPRVLEDFIGDAAFTVTCPDRGPVP